MSPDFPLATGTRSRNLIDHFLNISLYVVLPEERAEIGDFLLEDVLEAPVLGEVLEGAVRELSLHLPRLAARGGDAAVSLVEHLQICQKR